jgi:hypothetical protein
MCRSPGRVCCHFVQIYPCVLSFCVLNQQDEEEEDEVEDVVADEQLEFLRLELRKKKLSN